MTRAKSERELSKGKLRSEGCHPDSSDHSVGARSARPHEYLSGAKSV